MKCKGCNHDDYVHQAGEGQCQAWITKYNTPAVQTDRWGDSLSAYSRSTEYEAQCPCQQFTNIKPPKKPTRRKNLLEMTDKEYAALPETMRQQHNHYPL